MDNRYHRAAQDGRTELLKEAFKAELNKPDDNGMTPTLWAAYVGDFEALRVCCKRGGDINKCDYSGNSALHLAAQKGHLNCVSFLVNFGSNLWQLDNDYHTALMLAGRRGHDECVHFLDNAVLKAKSSNPKRVREKEEKAKKEAEKRIKKYDKLKKEQEQKMDQFHNKSRRISTTKGEPAGDKRRTSVTSMPYSEVSQSTKPLFATERISSKYNQFTISTNGRTEWIRGVGSQQLTDVMYKPSEEMDEPDRSTPGKRGAVRDIFPEHTTQKNNPQSVFGTRAMRGNFTVNSMYSLLKADTNSDISYGDAIVPPTSKPVFNNRNHDDTNHSDEESSEDEEIDPLVSFLDSLNLLDYLPLLQEQKMDMESLGLCSSEDLTAIGLAMGPKKKILHALQSRKENEDQESELTSF